MTLERSKDWWMSRARREGDAPVGVGLGHARRNAAAQNLLNLSAAKAILAEADIQDASMDLPDEDPVTTFRQAADAFTTQHTASEDAANACLVEAGIQDASGDLTAEYQENPAAGEKE